MSVPYDDRYKRFVGFVSELVKAEDFGAEFKTHPDFCYMLEHVTPKQGAQYWMEIQSRFPRLCGERSELLRLAETNDGIGGPVKSEIPSFGLCSPTNLRYILHALMLLEHYASLSVCPEVELVEIGGGYGGLCFFTHRLAEQFGLEIGSYTIFDIEAVCRLQKTVLGKLGLTKVIFAQSRTPRLPERFVVTSHYCFGELSEGLRNEYSATVLSKAQGGFVTLNEIEFYRFAGEDRAYQVTQEIPLTGPRNQYVFF